MYQQYLNQAQQSIAGLSSDDLKELLNNDAKLEERVNVVVRALSPERTRSTFVLFANVGQCVCSPIACLIPPRPADDARIGEAAHPRRQHAPGRAQSDARTAAGRAAQPPRRSVRTGQGAVRAGAGHAGRFEYATTDRAKHTPSNTPSVRLQKRKPPRSIRTPRTRSSRRPPPNRRTSPRPLSSS